MKYFTFRDWLADLAPDDIVSGVLLGVALIMAGLLMVGLR